MTAVSFKIWGWTQAVTLQPRDRWHMVAESTAQLVSDLVQAFNAHDPRRAAALYASDYEGIDVGQADPQQGPEGIRRALTTYFAAFPDAEITAEDTIVDSDRIVQIWTARGTHTGTLMHIPPTGRRVAIQGVSVLTVRDGRIRRGLYMWDVAGLLRSIGLLPEL